MPIYSSLRSLIFADEIYTFYRYIVPSVHLLVLMKYTLLLICRALRSLFVVDEIYTFYRIPSFLNYYCCVVPNNHFLVLIKYTLFTKIFKLSKALVNYTSIILLSLLVLMKYKLFTAIITFYCWWNLHFLPQINYFLKHYWFINYFPFINYFLKHYWFKLSYVYEIYNYCWSLTI